MSVAAWTVVGVVVWLLALVWVIGLCRAAALGDAALIGSIVRPGSSRDLEGSNHNRKAAR